MSTNILAMPASTHKPRTKREQHRHNIRDRLAMRDTTALVIRNSGVEYKVIAENAKVGATTVSRLASGETREPRMSTCIAILLSLGYTIEVYK